MFFLLKDFLDMHPDAVPALDKDGNKIISIDGKVLYMVPKNNYIEREEKAREEFIKSLEEVE